MPEPYIIHKPYDAVIVDIVTLGPNQEKAFPAAIVDGVFGTIYTQGEIQPLDGRTWGTAVPLHVWRTPASWSIWTGKPGPSEAVIKAGPDGVQWVCLSRTRGADRAIRQLLIEPLIVPAGWGLVVAFGNVVLGNQAGEQGNYFAPRDEDREVTGSGDLLLVR